MFRLIYVSKAAAPLSADDVAQILASAQQNNRPQEVTGMLCFNQEQFLQCLEGPKRSVEAIYAKILSDPRHTEIQTLCYDDIDTRLFSDWAMAYVSLNEENTRAILAKHHMEGKFAPRFLSEAEVLDLIQDFSKYLANTVVVG